MHVSLLKFVLLLEFVYYGTFWECKCVAKKGGRTKTNCSLDIACCRFALTLHARVTSSVGVDYTLTSYLTHLLITHYRINISSSGRDTGGGGQCTHPNLCITLQSYIELSCTLCQPSPSL